MAIQQSFNSSLCPYDGQCLRTVVDSHGAGIAQGAVGLTFLQDITMAVGARWKRPTEADCTREYLEPVYVVDERHSRCMMAVVRLDTGVLRKYIAASGVQTLEEFSSQGPFCITTTMFAMLGGNPVDDSIHPVVESFEIGQLPAWQVLGCQADAQSPADRTYNVDISKGGATAINPFQPRQ